MKKHFTHENLERFLKESADDLQMRPANNVWRHIERRLNRRKRRVFLTSAFFLVTASLFGYLIIDQSKQVTDPFASIHTIDKKVTTAPATASNKQPTTHNTSSSNATAAANHVFPHALATPVFQNPIGPLAVPAPGTVAGLILFTPTIVDEHQPFETVVASTTTSAAKPRGYSEVPTIESVVNTYTPGFKKKRSEFQVYFTPTISYRRLTENKSYLRAVPQNLATVNLAALYDVNSMVTHKPDLGIEFGLGYKFPVTQRIKLRAGMQFNLSRYDIKAFTYVPERTTIALNNRTRGIDSVNTLSSYRNFSSGLGANWIQNFYFQVSTPVGVEVAMGNARKTHFGVAATIQPTYVLGDRAYLISTDYKNYSQVPWLMRRWNVNTSLETFVSYSTGKLRWQVGPQVRYQLLSSFVQKYPVKENLFDFGMKVAVSLDKK